jgi:hypothetical protein
METKTTQRQVPRDAMQKEEKGNERNGSTEALKGADKSARRAAGSSRPAAHWG